MSKAETINAQAPLYDELDDGRVSIAAKLTPEIDPSQWALLCNRLGQLDPLEFQAIFDRFSFETEEIPLE